MAPVKPKEVKIKPLTNKDFLSLLKMEKEIYPEELVQGKVMLQDIKGGKGLKYSMMSFGRKETSAKEERVGYLVAVENKNKKGEQTIYLEDIAVLRKARGQGIAWEMLKKLIRKLQARAKQEDKPILWEMHLRNSSQGLFEKHKGDLKKMGIEIVEEALKPHYYSNSEDALHRTYIVPPQG